MDATVSFHCPCCDAGLIFDAAKQKFTCEFCLSEFEEAELAGTDAAGKSEQREQENEEFRSQVHGYFCPSCGAEVIADASTVADTCYYCHNPLVLSDKLAGVWRPDKVIPFKLDKEAAKETLLRYTKKKRFIPSDFFAPDQLEKISGVYFPFWVTDADTHSSYDGVGHRVRTWRSGDYRYTETSDFAVHRAGDIHFEDIVTAALSTADKKMLEGILPYPSDAYVDFSMPYLQGFLAKKRDVERESINGEIRKRMNSYAGTLLSRTVSGYASVTAPRTDVNVLKSHFEYSLLPIWILTYQGKRKNKRYVYAINGMTGKIYGELPISIPKLLLLAGGIFAGVLLLCLLIGGVFF